MKKYVFIEGDVNDADYVARLSPINKEEEKLIKKVAKLIKKNKNRPNWDEDPQEVYNLTEEEYYAFEEFVPVGEDSIHTITEIKILEVSKSSNLL